MCLGSICICSSMENRMKSASIEIFTGLRLVQVFSPWICAIKNQVKPLLRSGDGHLKAPIPGLVAKVLVAVGEQVEAGQPLLILEAMKMENEIRAPLSGWIKTLNVAPGQSVSHNELLAEIVE